MTSPYGLYCRFPRSSWSPPTDFYADILYLTYCYIGSNCFFLRRLNCASDILRAQSAFSPRPVSHTLPGQEKINNRNGKKRENSSRKWLLPISDGEEIITKAFFFLPPSRSALLHNPIRVRGGRKVPFLFASTICYSILPL